jgi:hypothetical protein
MNRVGILTLPLHFNYGGNLQAFALIKIIERMGFEPILIERSEDYQNSRRYALKILKRILKKFVLGHSQVELFPEVIKSIENRFVGQHAIKFIARHIPYRTRPYYSTADLRNVIGEYNLSAIVVGSDQVWRPDYTPNILDYFLDFASGSKIKKISYAASFGVTEWKVGFSSTKRISKNLKEFKFVGVREDTGVEMCQKYFNADAKQVLDPTLLLCRADYEPLIDNQHSSIQKERVLLVYYLDETEDKMKVVQKIADELQLTIFRANGKSASTDAEIAERVAPPISYWLSNFRDAEFIVTDSFHACAFALLYNKPFIAYGNKSRGLTRFTSLLKQVNLEEKLIVNSEDLDYSNAVLKWNWEDINTRIALLRHDSIIKLQEALG